MLENSYIIERKSLVPQDELIRILYRDINYFYFLRISGNPYGRFHWGLFFFVFWPIFKSLRIRLIRKTVEDRVILYMIVNRIQKPDLIQRKQI